MPRGGKRAGAGRKAGDGKGEGLGTKVSRHCSSITREQLDAIPRLIDLINHYEDNADDSPRWYHCRKLIDEIRTLGY